MTLDPSELLAAALRAQANAYAPYSQFFVGAAILATDGRIFGGANVENASYGLSMCAERVALFHAVEGGARHFDAVVIVGPRDALALPCGACRQVLHEFGPLEVIVCEAGRLRSFALEALLPDPFGPLQLGLHPRGAAPPRVIR